MFKSTHHPNTQFACDAGSGPVQQSSSLSLLDSSPPPPGPSSFSLTEIKEPETCRYTLTLVNPIPCRLLHRGLEALRLPLSAVQPLAQSGVVTPTPINATLQTRLRRLCAAVGAALGRLLRAVWRRVKARGRGLLARGRPATRLAIGGAGDGSCGCGKEGEGGGGSLVSEVKGLRDDVREIKRLVLQQGQGQPPVQ